MNELEIKLRCLEAASKIHEGQARADDSENARRRVNDGVLESARAFTAWAKAS